MIIRRATDEVISTDPSGLKGDTTTWEYDLATGLELRKTYADGKGTVKLYGSFSTWVTHLYHNMGYTCLTTLRLFFTMSCYWEV